jgi:uncharacterized protein YpuA (DUF1002 family)
MSRTYGSEEKTKLLATIDQCVQVLQEVDDLKAGMRDTVKAVAEELDIKPKLLNKAISIAFKGNWNEVNEDFDELENILVTTGRDQ